MQPTTSRVVPSTFPHNMRMRKSLARGLRSSRKRLQYVKQVLEGSKYRAPSSTHHDKPGHMYENHNYPYLLRWF